MIEKGKKFFWNTVFPYVITDITAEHIYYKREGYAERRIYKYVFEEAIEQNRIEFIN
ncbi:MAG: hypothetical protein PHX40_04100 [Bacilli bacterium]|nr:hypothetical protein [Bacilli bacterium]